MDKTTKKRIENWWEQMTERYTSKDPATSHNLGLKKQHSLSTKTKARDIAASLSLSDEDQTIAEIIGLLHDSGRFPQYFYFRTFQDNRSKNHALWGSQLLQEEDVLEDCTAEEKKWIIESVYNHNQFKIKESLDEGTKLFCQIIRDADKFDIYRVMTESEYILELKPGKELSPKIVQSIRNHQCALYQDICNESDFKLLQLSWVFDLSFDWTLRQIHTSQLLQRFYNTIEPSPQLEEVWQIILEFIKKKLSCA